MVIARKLATRRGQRRAFQVLCALTLLALAPITWMFVTTEGYVGSVRDAPSAPVAVVFGAGLSGNRPAPYLAHRLDAAVQLYRQGSVRAILVTGDNSRSTYDETDAMRSYLAKQGVPTKRIAADYAGFDTWDSCARAKRIFGVEQAVVISQAFHIRRAVALCRAVGVDSYGVAVDERHDITWYYGGTREVFASVKGLWDAVVQPDPHFLGPRDRSVEEALAIR